MESTGTRRATVVSIKQRETSEPLDAVALTELAARLEEIAAALERADGAVAHTLYQADGWELTMLSRLFDAARAAWQHKRDYLKAGLLGGARVEPGLLAIQLAPRSNPGYVVEPYDYEVLVVK